MKKIIPLTLLVMLLCGFMTVNAGTLKGNVYTFDNINAKVTFSSEGTYKNINGEPVLIFPKPVTMKIEGEADNGMLCDINVLKYSDEAFEYETADNFMDTVTLYTNSDFAETEVPEGAHLLVLSAKDDRGGGIPIIVGDIKINKINLPENAKISGWATKEVSEAFDSGLITTELYNNNDYQRNITRGEFAHVMAALLEQAGISYDKYIKGLGVNPIANFADTKNDFLIEFVHSCGIINGMSDHEFDPSGILTREQAATMLVRTVSYLGSHVTVTAVSPFSDAKTFSDWATESIYKIAGIHDKNNGSAIMGGIAVGVFSPKTGYTVEQALIAAKRLLSAIIV